MMRLFKGNLHRLMVMCAGLSLTYCAGPIGMPITRAPGFVASYNMMPPVGAFTVQGQEGYLSYHAGTLGDAVDYRFVRNVKSEVCQRGIGVPFALVASLIGQNNINAALTADVRFGDGSLNTAVREAMSQAAPDEALVDVILDVHYASLFSVLYRQTCLVLHGKVMAPLVRGLDTEPLVPQDDAQALPVAPLVPATPPADPKIQIM